MITASGQGGQQFMRVPDIIHSIHPEMKLGEGLKLPSTIM